MGSRWRDGRSVLLVSAGGSDARTEASGMMAYPARVPPPKPPAVAHARRYRVARAAARGRPPRRSRRTHLP